MADFRNKPDANPVPPFVGWMIVTLMVSTLAIAGWAQWGPYAASGARALPPVVEARDILLDINRQGEVFVRDPSGAEIARFDSDQSGFIGAMARVVQRQRIKQGIDTPAPISLSRHTDGSVRVTDTVSDWSANLNGFGADNAKAFARLLAL